MKSAFELARNLNIKIHDVSLYELALTHPSYNADAKTKHHDYERLEYMGDAVLGFVTADIIFKIHKNMNPGDMTKLRSMLVRSEALASYARIINLNEYIRAGKSVSTDQVSHSNKILEDIFEALIGAIYLDQGIVIATTFIRGFIVNSIKNFDLESLTDAKTRLQEYIQAESRDNVKYVVVEESGPAHDKLFKVNVIFNDLVFGTGVGKSKKIAEENAAQDALNKRCI